MKKLSLQIVTFIMFALFLSLLLPLIAFLGIIIELKISTIENAINMIKELVQILFYIATAWIAWCTYRQAKRTLFSPMKNELFKRQLKIFEEVEDFFWKINDPKSLYNEFHYKNIFIYNSCIIYIKHKDQKNDPAKAIWDHDKELTIGMIKTSSEFLSNKLVKDYNEESKYDNFYLHSEFLEKWKILHNISISTFIPESIQDSSKILLQEVESVLFKIQQFLLENDIKIISSDSFNPTLLYDTFEIDKKELFQAYIDFINKIRSYTKTDEIMK